MDKSGGFKANWSINIDPLSSVMLLVKIFVSLVHIYSIGYMVTIHKPRFMSYLHYLLSMLALVVSDNFLQLFLMGGVGLCSYLLIGFWYKKKQQTMLLLKLS